MKKTASSARSIIKMRHDEDSLRFMRLRGTKSIVTLTELKSLNINRKLIIK